MMAAVDHVVGLGVADADRLGVGGWSYGGILTDYVITKTGRFKAAISGASEANYLANYGTDHYQYEWETELGLPWQNLELWMRLSPWFSVEKVTTPTLLLCGADDLNVPLVNSEQLYQALRRLGRETRARHLSGREPRHLAAQLPGGPLPALRRLVRQVPEAGRGQADARWSAPEATSLLGRPLQAPALSAEREATLETNLENATAESRARPDDADAIIWLGAAAPPTWGRFRDAASTSSRAAVGPAPRDRTLLSRPHLAGRRSPSP